jgi:hypothetical protein
MYDLFCFLKKRKKEEKEKEKLIIIMIGRPKGSFDHHILFQDGIVQDEGIESAFCYHTIAIGIGIN